MTITQSPTETTTVTDDPDHAVATSGPDTPAMTAPDPGRPARRSRTILSWIAVGAAVAAAGVLAVSVIASDDHPRQLTLQHGVGDAKDHIGNSPNPPVRHVTHLQHGVGDAKDHIGNSPNPPVRHVTHLQHGVGDAKDHDD